MENPIEKLNEGKSLEGASHHGSSTKSKKGFKRKFAICVMYPSPQKSIWEFILLVESIRTKRAKIYQLSTVCKILWGKLMRMVLHPFQLQYPLLTTMFMASFGVLYVAVIRPPKHNTKITRKVMHTVRIWNVLKLMELLEKNSIHLSPVQNIWWEWTFIINMMLYFWPCTIVTPAKKISAVCCRSTLM